MTEIEINTKIFRKDNLDIVYSITGKKHLNGILHYKLRSDNSEEIFLSEYAVNDRFLTETKNFAQPKNSVSRLFTKMLKNKFYIGVMSPDGSGERLLAQGYLVEGPTWAPNGRVLMYFKQSAPIDDGKSASVNLFKIDITGFRETRIVTPSDGSDPAWSPLLPN